MFKDLFVRKSICLLLAVSIFIAGCGGTNPNPVERYMPGDEDRSCRALLSETTMIDNEVAEKQQKIRDREVWNVILFIGGLFVIVPFFFIDCKKSYEAEIDALRARKKLLRSYFAEKDCSVADPSPREKAIGSRSEAEHKGAASKTSEKASAESPASKTWEKTCGESPPRFSGSKQKCATCGKTIAKFGKHFVCKEAIVCEDCYNLIQAGEERLTRLTL